MSGLGMGKLAGKAIIVEPNGRILIAAENSVLHEGDLLVLRHVGHSDEDDQTVIIDVHQDKVILQEQENLTELAMPDNFDLSDILAAVEEGRDPTLLEGVATEGGNADGSSSITAQSVIESGNSAHVYTSAGFNTQSPLFDGLPFQQLSSLGRVLNADKDEPIASLTGDSTIEEGMSASYTVSISKAVDTDTHVSVSISHKTSESGDITPITRDVVIVAGQTSATFTFDIIDDVFDETADSDTYTVSISNIETGDPAQNIAAPPAIETHIRDENAFDHAENNDAPNLSLSGSETVVEGESATYELLLSHIPKSDVIITVGVTRISAEGDDVQESSRQITILAGTNSAKFTIETIDDVFDESDDNDVFSVVVSGVEGGGFERQPSLPESIKTTINDGDANAPILTLTGDSSVNEGESASYTLTISEAPTSNLTVAVVVGHKTSEDGDVTPVTREVVIAANTTSTDFTVATLDDSILETTDDDVFEVSVTGTSGGGFEVLPDNPSAVETTINEDTTGTDKPTLTLTGDASVIEGAEASYTLTISEAPMTALTVTVVVGHKTSEDGDVTPVTREVVIAANTTSTVFTVATLDDSILETNDDDVFEVSVTGTAGGGFEVLPDNPSAVETTINEDTTGTDKPTLTLTGDASVIEGAEASYTLTISEAPMTALTVTVVVGHKTSEDGDVTPVTREVVIAANTTSTDFTVATLDDAILETTDDDVFEVSVTGTSGGGFEVLPDNPSAVETTINEDTTSTDKPTLTLTGDASVIEGAEASYTLTISEAPTSNLTVTVVVGHKTSEDGDVTPVTREVVIAANTTSTDFTVATLDDSILETTDDDVFEVSVTGTSGGGFEELPDNPSAVETTINEDTTGTDKPTLTLTGDASVIEGEEASYTLTISEAPATALTVTVVVGHKTSEDGDVTPVTPVTREVVIAANTTSTNFTVATLDDSILETNDDDVFEVSVTGTSGGGYEVLPDNPA
ncbi:hypothetical protein LRP50_20320, partial [Enterovibrio sp. ZSDZ42]|nr:hypothetical protein [Enterovibrio sp. ZSDZ42]